jgi:hypothetical protein
MIDVQLHQRGEQVEQRQLPAVPCVGCFVFGPAPAGPLCQVDAVVFEGPAIHVYCLIVSDRLAKELTGAWEAWGGPSQSAIADKS